MRGSPYTREDEREVATMTSVPVVDVHIQAGYVVTVLEDDSLILEPIDFN